MMTDSTASTHSVTRRRQQQQQEQFRCKTTTTTKITGRTLTIEKYGSFLFQKKSSSCCLMILFFLSNLLFFFTSNILVSGYPLLIEIEEDAERCVRFNVPEGDE